MEESGMQTHQSNEWRNCTRKPHIPTFSETTPEGVKAISPQLAVSLATAHGVTLRRSIDYTLLPDSQGYYRGTTDSIYRPNGHGCWQGYDGTYYEGYWKNGKREGFGFSIAPKKPLRIGEWKMTAIKAKDSYIHRNVFMALI